MIIVQKSTLSKHAFKFAQISTSQFVHLRLKTCCRMSTGSRWKPIFNNDIGMQTKKNTEHTLRIDRSRLEHSITPRCGPSEYNSEMVGVLSESEPLGQTSSISPRGARKESWTLRNIIKKVWSFDAFWSGNQVKNTVIAEFACTFWGRGTKECGIELAQAEKNGLPACRLAHHCLRHLSFEYRKQFRESCREEMDSGNGQVRGKDAGLGKARGSGVRSCGDSSWISISSWPQLAMQRKGSTKEQKSSTDISHIVGHPQIQLLLLLLTGETL